MNMNMNEKGRQTKLLAAVAILAMVVCAFAVVMPFEDVNADYNSATDGPLNFYESSLSCGDYGDLTVSDVAENLSATYNSNTKTYTVYGTLFYQAFTQTDKTFYKGWVDNDSCHYGLPFSVNVTSGSFSVQLNDGNASTCTDNKEECLFYINPYAEGNDTFTVKITNGDTVETYTVNYSNVDYVINVAKGSAAGSPAENWTYTETTLALNGYDGVEAFSGAIGTITVTGDNTITVNPVMLANSETGDRFAAINSTSTLNIGGAGSLTIDMNVDDVIVDKNMNGDKVAGIYSTNAITINCGKLTIDIDGVVKQGILDPGQSAYSEAVYGIYASTNDISITNTEIDITVAETDGLAFAVAYGDQTYTDVTGQITGGNRAIQIGATTVSFDDSALTLTGGEKAIQAKSGGATKIELKGDTGSNITLKLSDVYLNTGDNDRFGLKLNGTLTVADKSVLTTDGLRLMGADAAAPTSGTVIVNGDYEQNPEADILMPISGLYVDDADTGFTATRGSAPSTGAAGIYLTDDAEVFGNVNVKNSSGTVTDKAVSAVADANIALADATTQVVTLNVPSDGLQGLDISSVPETKTFIINATAGAVSGELELKGSTAVLENVKGYLYVSEGSVVIDGMEMEGTIKDIDGTVRISGDATGELTFQKAADADTARVIVEGNLAVATGVTINFVGVELVVTDEGTINLANNAESNLVGTEMSISGKVLGTTGTIDADEDSSVYVTSGGIIAPVLTGEGAYYIDDAMQEYRISKDVVSDINTTSQQKVYIDNSITIYSGFTVYIAGTLEVADGMRVIIEDGAQLIVEGVNSTADISGNIIIKGANGFQFTGKTMTVDGSISVNSNSTTSALIIDGETELNGTITVQKNAAASLDEISVNAGATLTVNGMASGDVTNYGSVVMNGAAAAAGFTVSQQEGGVVTVASVSGTMSVTDNGMVLRKGIVAGTSAGIGYNTISFNNVTGMTVTSSVGSQTGNNGQKVYFPVMTLTGTAGAVKDASSPTVGIIAGTVTVSDLLTIGKIGVNIGSGAELDVTGTVNALSEAGTWSITGAGTLDVTGLVKTNEPIHGTGGVANINAVHYELIENSVPYYYYTNLTDALAVDVDDLEVLGNITILENTVIPDGKTVTANDIQVGDADHTDVTLTIENGALLDAGVITVIGTMEVQNDDDLDATRVVSDVSSKVEVDYITSVTYTNIYTALAQAQSGETVKITSVSGTVYLTQDVTIPAGVTLEVPTQKTLSVMEGVTLAVDGTLYLNNGDLTAFKYDNDAPMTGVFGTVASETVGNTTTNRAVVTVTGMIQTNTDFDYGTYFVSGAYYDIKNYSYVTTVEKAVAVIADVDAMTIDVWGTNTIGDISVAGSADEDAILNIMYYYDAEDGIKTGGFTAGKVTLSNATVNVDGGVVLNATFANAVGSVELVNMVAGTAPISDDFDMDVTVAISDIYVTVNGEETQTFTVSGTVNGVTAEKVNSASVTFDGAVTVMDDLTIDPKYQYTTGTSKVGSVIVVGDVTVTGNDVEFKVDSSIENSNVIIDGILTAINAGKITLENATVNGTLTEAVKTETNTVGDISVGTLYVGLTSKDLGAAGAVVNGGVSVTSAMYVLNGCTVDSLITDNQKYTEFYVEGALWMTAYVFGVTTTVTVKDCPAENATLEGWNDEDGNGVGFEVTVSNNKVYADLEYEIYTITVFADPGIDAVYIDGKLMTSGFFMGGFEGMLYEGFQLKVAAGTHEITYKLGNYYSGEANLIVNGEAVTGNSFSCSGTEPADKIVTIYLQGIEASAPGTPETSSDSGMGLTDYLLIILVVLIVIMAIMVALRLMRS